MIPAPPGLVVRLKVDGEGQERYLDVRVVAFDDDGLPLFAIPTGDKPYLGRADREPGYVGLVDQTLVDQKGEFTALIPGGGWRVEYTGADGTKLDIPLVGWGIRTGYPIPLTTVADGVVVEAAAPLREGFSFRIYHPDTIAKPASAEGQQ